MSIGKKRRASLAQGYVQLRHGANLLRDGKDSIVDRDWSNHW